MIPAGTYLNTVDATDRLRTGVLTVSMSSRESFLAGHLNGIKSMQAILRRQISRIQRASA